MAKPDSEAQPLILAAYLVNDRPAGIRPGALRRDWMDRTHDRFAYRCLPLTMANQSGWDLLCPASFTAVWNGGDSLHDICIESDEPAPGVLSHFGHGILTFEVNVLFRSSPGHNLWVKGPPNRPKDGISPLEGIVETDWSNATFTMNWQITRPDIRIAFERDEPFCRIVPFPRHYLEHFETATIPVDDAPEIRERYRRWSNSRREFNENLDPARPKKQAWQKHYHHGRDSGGETFGEHQTRLRLKPFPPVGD